MSTQWAQVWEAVQQLNQPGVGRLSKREIGKKVSSYFQHQHQVHQGQLTPELIEQAGKIYDVPGLRALLAEALGFEGVFALQVLLGQPSQVLHVHYDHLNLRERYREEWVRHRAVDVELAVLSNPMESQEFRHRLADVRGRWEDGVDLENPYLRVRYAARGCMACGALDSTLTLFLLKDEALPRDPDIYFWSTAAIHANRFCGFEWSRARQFSAVPLPPAERIAQVVWRVAPGEFFNYFIYLPLWAMPVVVICAECAVNAPDTHARLVDDAQQNATDAPSKSGN